MQIGLRVGGGVNYFEDHIGDYAAATAHLTWDEDMAYTRLIRAYYHSEKPIPQGQAYRLARATTPAQRKAVDAVLAEFFTLQDDGYHQKRCDEEIARFQDKQAKAKRSAQARWNAKPPQSEGNANASPDAMRTHSEGNAPRHQTPDTSNTPPPPPARAPEPSIEVFAMHSGWQPSPAFQVQAKLAGLPVRDEAFIASGTREFIGYWLTRPGECKTAAEWDHALAKSLKHEQARAASAQQQRPAAARRPTSHTGFAEKDYTAGVNPDGSLA
jgi:uncharacterized protein YdaU (DUF1376 family)